MAQNPSGTYDLFANESTETLILAIDAQGNMLPTSSLGGLTISGTYSPETAAIAFSPELTPGVVGFPPHLSGFVTWKNGPVWFLAGTFNQVKKLTFEGKNFFLPFQHGWYAVPQPTAKPEEA